MLFYVLISRNHDLSENLQKYNKNINIQSIRDNICLIKLNSIYSNKYFYYCKSNRNIL